MYDALIGPFIEFEFMRRALVGAIALSLGGAPVGVFLMLRRMSLMATARHRKKVEVLRSVPGVGVVTAMTFQTELLGPQRFTQPGEVAKMIGLAPLVQESGERRREGSLIKAGNWRLRTILVEAAWRWVRQDDGAKTLYRRCVRNTGDGKKAIVAVARKLAIMLWRMVTREEMYRGRAAAA